MKNNNETHQAYKALITIIAILVIVFAVPFLLYKMAQHGG